MLDLEKINIVYGKTEEEWLAKYDKELEETTLWSFSLEDVLDGAVELNENMCYWYIDGRFYETLEQADAKPKPKKKIPAKRPPMKNVSKDVVVTPEMFEEIRKAELASAMNILHDNGYVAVTKDEYQALTNPTKPKLCVKEARLYVLYKGELSGYIARVCNDSPSVTSLVKVQSQLAEDGYWVSKVCSSPTDNEIFMICYKEGD